jgi:hypothetical protein
MAAIATTKAPTTDPLSATAPSGFPLAVGLARAASNNSAPAVRVTGANPNRSPLVQLYLYVEYVPFQAVFLAYQALPTCVRLHTAETVPLRLQRLTLDFY